jgi:phosphoribosylpyrophosphate synthetase
MTVQILADAVDILEKHIRFSDGGSNIKIKTGLSPKNIVVTIKNEPVDSYAYLLRLITTLLFRNFTYSKTVCHLPYLPHGRADREFEEGMVTPLLEIGYLLSFFDEVIIRDAHSNFIEDYMLLHHDTEYTEISQLRSFLDCPFGLEKYDFDVLVAPDKGAKDKTQTIADQLKVPVVFCEFRS